jgi:hemerythrin-like domain-containing protein
VKFADLQLTHRELTEYFLLHQEALLELDLELALVHLNDFEQELRAHMEFEEEVLMPVYRRAGSIPGGPVEFFMGEHRRMLEFLARFKESLEPLLKQPPTAVSREVLTLLDAEAAFKRLAEHHNQREQNIFFPALDRVTSEEERAALLALGGTLVGNLEAVPARPLGASERLSGSEQ